MEKGKDEGNNGFCGNITLKCNNIYCYLYVFIHTHTLYNLPSDSEDHDEAQRM